MNNRMVESTSMLSQSLLLIESVGPISPDTVERAGRVWGMWLRHTTESHEDFLAHGLMERAVTCASRLLVGSSSSRMSGADNSVRAIATRRRSPPDSVATAASPAQQLHSQ